MNHRHSILLVIISHRYNFLAEGALRSLYGAEFNLPVLVIHTGKGSSMTGGFKTSPKAKQVTSTVGHLHCDVLNALTFSSYANRVTGSSFDWVLVVDHDAFVDGGKLQKWAVQKTEELRGRSEKTLLVAQEFTSSWRRPKNISIFHTWPFMLINVSQDAQPLWEAARAEVKRGWDHTRSPMGGFADTGQNLGLELQRLKLLDIVAREQLPDYVHVNSVWRQKPKGLDTFRRLVVERALKPTQKELELMKLNGFQPKMITVYEEAYFKKL